MQRVIEDPDRCYQAAHSKDARFDGVFFVGVTSTGIYCRPSCPARTPKRENVRFYSSAAAAQQAGFRACLRCRPDATPGSPEWNTRADVVARAMRLLRDGTVDREGVEGLARRLGYSVRQLNRLVTAEIGTGPLAIARAQRAQTARILLETTTLPIAHVAFAAGFSSVRQCNETLQQIFADTPRGLRNRVARGDAHRHAQREADGVAPAIRLRLPCRRPFSPDSVLGFLGARAAPGVELVEESVYRRSMRLPHGYAVVSLSATESSDDGPQFVEADLQLSDLRDLTSAAARCRQLLDLDADPVAIVEALERDRFMGPLVAALPGRRVPGSVDGFELAVRAIIGQQVSVSGARTIAGRLITAAGEALPEPIGGITHLFPTPDALLALSREDPAAFSMPGGRRRALSALARRRRHRRRRHRPRIRSFRVAGLTGGVAGRRAVDGRVHRPACPARSRRLHADRPWRKEGGAGAGAPRRTGPTDTDLRGVASVAELRHDPHVGHARGTEGPQSTERTYRSMTPTIFTMPMETPVGPLVLESDEDVLIGIWLPNTTRAGGGSGHGTPPVLKDTATQLEEYFARERTSFDIPMQLDGTPFQKEVWAELSRIPYGETISYGELARRVGRPKGPRAVGQANGKNPIPIIVPCHRVVATNGLGGYGGGLTVKSALLAVEGVTG